MILVLALSLALLASCLQAQPQLPAAPALAARSYLLYDFRSGQTLVSHNAEERVEPASLTKLMTAYLVFGALKDKRIAPADVLAVSERAWRA